MVQWAHMSASSVFLENAPRLFIISGRVYIWLNMPQTDKQITSYIVKQGARRRASLADTCAATLALILSKWSLNPRKGEIKSSLGIYGTHRSIILELPQGHHFLAVRLDHHILEPILNGEKHCITACKKLDDERVRDCFITDAFTSNEVSCMISCNQTCSGVPSHHIKSSIWVDFDPVQLWGFPTFFGLHTRSLCNSCSIIITRRWGERRYDN